MDHSNTQAALHYHQQTKHFYQGVRDGSYTLDWANRADLLRRRCHRYFFSPHPGKECHFPYGSREKHALETCTAHLIRLYPNQIGQAKIVQVYPLG